MLASSCLLLNNIISHQIFIVQVVFSASQNSCNFFVVVSGQQSRRKRSHDSLYGCYYFSFSNLMVLIRVVPIYVCTVQSVVVISLPLVWCAKRLLLGRGSMLEKLRVESMILILRVFPPYVRPETSLIFIFFLHLFNGQVD